MKRLRRPILFGAGSFAGLLMFSHPLTGTALLLLVLIVGVLTEPVL